MTNKKPKRLIIQAKCADRCFATLLDEDGNEIIDRDGYPPVKLDCDKSMNNIYLDIDLETKTAKPFTFTDDDIETWISEETEEEE